MVSLIPSPADFSADAFDGYLGRYPDVIAAVSKEKGVKPGQKSLAELDKFRYDTAPSTFSSAKGRAMEHEDVLTLVSWKLRHGKFRPTLMKLVESNSPAAVKKTVQEAVQAYRDATSKSGSKKKLDGHPEAALNAVKILCALRGIGPATASLLVAVHFPKEAIFFSDEAYAWLCGGSAHSFPSKYNAKEYEEVARGMVELLERLPDKYGAQDVEQVAYVVLYDKKNGPPATEAKGAKVDESKYLGPTGVLEKTPPYPIQGKDTKRHKPAPAENKRRKEPPTDADPESSKRTRRSGRLQK